MSDDRKDEFGPIDITAAQRAIIDAVKRGERITIGMPSGRAAAGREWNRYLWDLAVVNAAQGEPTYVV